MFMDAIRDNILENHNVSITENGAIGYETTGKNLLDLNFSVASLRNVSEAEIAERFYKAFLEDKNLAMRRLFYKIWRRNDWESRRNCWTTYYVVKN